LTSSLSFGKWGRPDQRASLKPVHCGPVYGRPALPGTRPDQSPHGLIMTGAGVVDDQCGVVSQTSGGVSLKEAHPYAHPPRPPSHPASRCAPSPYQVPWPNVRRGLFLPRSPIGSLRRFFRQFTTLFHHVDFSVILRVRPDDG
jgi:hypothetical protein